MRSYARRKEWEAKLLAGQLAQVMAAAMGANVTGAGAPAGSGRVSPDVLLGQMGVRL
jgi:hypothetical protein